MKLPQSAILSIRIVWLISFRLINTTILVVIVKQQIRIRIQL